jgi:hypothetical protein
MRMWVIVVLALSSMLGVPLSPSANVGENISALLLARVAANNDGARRETTLPARLVKAVSGVSLLDIKRYHDWKGGPNSIANRPLGTLAPSLLGIDWNPSWAPAPLRTPGSDL